MVPDTFLPSQEYERARAVREHYAAEKARMDYEARKAQLIARSVVEHAWAKCTRDLRDSVMALPDRLSRAIAAEVDQVKIHALLTKEFRAALMPPGEAGR